MHLRTLVASKIEADYWSFESLFAETKSARTKANQNHRYYMDRMEDLKSKKPDLKNEDFKMVISAFNLGLVPDSNQLHQRFLDMSDSELCAAVQCENSGKAASKAVGIMIDRHSRSISIYCQKAKRFHMDHATAMAFLSEAVFRAMRLFNPDKAKFITYLSQWLNRNSRWRTKSWQSIHQETYHRSTEENPITSFSLDALDFDLTEAQKDHSELYSALETLGDSEKRVIFGYMSGTSRTEIARELDLKLAEIDEIQRKAFDELRGLLEPV